MDESQQTEKIAGEPDSDGKQFIENIVVPVVEEELEIQKRTVESGRVRLNKTVQERDVVVEEASFQEEIHIDRVPIDRFIDQPVGARQDGETVIIPVLEEVPVVIKRLKLKEELHVTKRRAATPQTQTVRLRSEVITVERLGPRPASDASRTDGESKEHLKAMEDKHGEDNCRIV